MTAEKLSLSPPQSAAADQIWRAILVCGLGYFIDVFDIQLYVILRVPSLTALGVTPDNLAQVSGNILNLQMTGMIVGAIIWGWLGDRYGRIKSLYGSILIYSLGTLACAFAQNVQLYAALRFITAVGLAGEIGAAVVLVSELMPAHKRGWGVTAIGAIGFLGPVCAVITSMMLDWRQTYAVAGVLGLVLLIIRSRLAEAAMFSNAERIATFNELLAYMRKNEIVKPFLLSLIVALPLAFAWNILNFFSMELSKTMLSDPAQFNQKTCLTFFFAGTCLGDIFSGVLTQMLESRRKAMVTTLAIGLASTTILVFCGIRGAMNVEAFYDIYFLLGAASGCWALATMIASEQVGIKVRATAASLLLNLLRASTIPMVMIFQSLKDHITAVQAATVIGVIVYAASFVCLSRLQETHGRDLDFNEV